MTLLYIIIAAAVGALIGWLAMRGRSAAQITGLHSSLARTEAAANAWKERYAEAKSTHAATLERMEKDHDEAMDQMRNDAERQRLDLRNQYNAQLAQLKQAQEEQMEQQMRLVKEQMQTASERILKQRSEELSVTNAQQLGAIINPLQQNIVQMKEAVEKNDREHSKTMERLDATIRESLDRTKEMGIQADRLAQALTAENKTQGNFGELRLRQLLEDMGLEEGLQFEEQTTLRDAQGNTIHEEEDGRALQPDVILHFPDHRDVIIDSKMSFTAYIDYQNAPDDATRAEALRRHIASVRQHVNELSRKNYSSYIRNGNTSLDFVLMYVFQESALQLALANDPTLWKEAYDRHVVISGSQNLYALLRVLELTWKQVRQVENQQEIMKCANDIINRTQLFCERFQKVEESLKSTQKAFDELSTVTAQSGQSITTAARQLLKYGAQENPKRKKRLPTDDQLQ